MANEFAMPSLDEIEWRELIYLANRLESNNRTGVLFEDVMIIEDRFSKYDIRAAILQNFENYWNPFARIESPAGFNLTDGPLTAAICELENVAVSWPFVDTKTMLHGESKHPDLSTYTRVLEDGPRIAPNILVRVRRSAESYHDRRRGKYSMSKRAVNNMICGLARIFFWW